MNPPEFIRSTPNEDLKNSIIELQKVFQVMHVTDVDRVELAAYQIKGVVRLWFDHWKKNKGERAPALT